MSRTNFEKWKEGLTPEEFVRGIGPIYECPRCPLAGGTWEGCKRKFGGGLCRNKILAWANAPAEEEE